MGGESLDPAARAQSIWTDTLAILGARMTVRQKAWLMGVVPESVNGPAIMLRVSDNNTFQQLVGELSMPLSQALQLANDGKPLYPAFKIDPTLAPSDDDEAADDSASASGRPSRTSGSTSRTTSTHSSSSTAKSFIPLPTDLYPVEHHSDERTASSISGMAGEHVTNQDGRAATLANAEEAHAMTASQGELPIPTTIPERHVAAVKEATTPLRDPVSHLNKAATFDTFVPGSSNRFARTVALAVAEGNGRDYNPLFIYGGSGLGKTHLLNAIGNYALVKDPTLRVRYVTSEEFTNEFIGSIRRETESNEAMTDFNKRYRDEVDMLLIDDIQFLSGKDSTLEQFFHTFNALKDADKRIVLSSDVPPKNLKGFEARLISRFESGLPVDVQPPDLETRTAILQMMAQNNGYSIPSDVIDLIAHRFTENIRELEGALTRITAMASITHQPVSYALAEQTLRDFFVADVELKPTDIIGQTAQYFHLTFDDLVGRSRTKNVALARQIAMYLTREMTSMSLVDIGQVFGGLDHTTVMYGCKKISSRMSEKKEIYNYVTELTVRLKNG